MNRNLVLLLLAQACYWFAVLIGISLSAVLGAQLAPHAGLATLPYTLISVSALFCTYAISVSMQRRGRRVGFQLGVAAGLLAALGSVGAIVGQSFYLFCAASVLMGVYQASSVYYRLAALDSVGDGQQGQAVGWVLSGSLLAAVLGPGLAGWAGSLFVDSAYLGPYLLTAGFGLLAWVLVSLLPSPFSQQVYGSAPAVGRAFLSRPLYWLGIGNTAFAQFAMMLMMIVAPLSMHQHHHYPVSTGISVIGWHIVGMFLPSFFSGRLLDRFSAPVMVLAGLGIFMLSALAALLGTETAHYYGSLFLLGLGWNFMYVAGTGQYNRDLAVHEKGRAQGMAEVAIALAAVLGAALGGWLLSKLDWQALNQGLLWGLVGMAGVNMLFWRWGRSGQD
ncbi:MAG: MFS transporter [Thiolinea sp.]